MVSAQGILAGVTLVVVPLTFLPVLWLAWETFVPPSSTVSQSANIGNSGETRTDDGVEMVGPVDQDPDKIVVGITVCAGGYSNLGRGKKEVSNIMKVIDEPLTLIKSILISASRVKAKHVEFRIFVDSWLVKNALQPTIAKFENTVKMRTKVTYFYHNVYKSIPRGYERDLIDSPRPCTYVPSFFPLSLPFNLEHILYLDTDNLVTGNITKIWLDFKEAIGTGKDTKLAGLVANADGEGYKKTLKSQFQDYPFVPPTGVNVGVMFMNLPGMRQWNWAEKVKRIFMERRDKMRGNQELINILFSTHADLLALLPCQYNWQHWHCEKEVSCLNGTQNATALQVIHGTGGVFREGGQLKGLYQTFRTAPLDVHEKADAVIFQPLSKLLAKKGGCFSLIGKNLDTGLPLPDEPTDELTTEIPSTDPSIKV